MPSRNIAMLLMLAGAAAAAELPDLRVEPTAGGSIFYIRNRSAQPLTGWLIELVDYPGSSYSLWQDDVTAPIAAFTEKRIQVTNMTVGAVPDYVKMQAAVYADGSSAGIPEKVASFIERRRFLLQTTRELIRRMGSTPMAALETNLKEWMATMQPDRRVSQATINQTAGRSLVQDSLARIQTLPMAEVLNALKTSERLLAGSKPAL
jgi:hypothetical protein